MANIAAEILNNRQPSLIVVSPYAGSSNALLIWDSINLAENQVNDLQEDRKY
jgi:hypothetical protein